MTAWQVGRIIGRNPASVSSRLHRMCVAKTIRAFLGKRRQILYAPLTLNAGVQAAYSFSSDTTPYSIAVYAASLQEEVPCQS